MRCRPCLRPGLAPAAVFAAVALALNPEVFGAEFNPPSFGAGQAVELSVPLPQGEWKDVTLKPGQGMPIQSPGADPEILEERIWQSPGGWRLTIRFVPWSPGQGSIRPMLPRGQAMPPIEYEAASWLGPETKEIAPPRPQREPPGTALFFYGLAGLGIIVILSTVGLAAWMIPAARRLLRQARAAQAWTRLRKNLAWLGAQVGDADPAGIHAVLAHELRIYLESRVLPGVLALTPSELALMEENSFPRPGFREATVELLAETELGRYSNEVPDPGATLEKALALGRAAEEAFDARL